MGNKNEKASFLKTDLYLQIGVCCDIGDGWLSWVILDACTVMMSMKYFDD